MDVSKQPKYTKILDYMWKDVKQLHDTEADEVMVEESHDDNDNYYYLEIRKNTVPVYRARVLKTTVDLAAGVS